MEEKWKTPAGTAAIAAAVCGLATHFYALTNTMHNYDDIIVQPGGIGSGMALGRWLLEIYGVVLRFLGWDYNLTWFNGVVFLLLLALSAGILCRVLEVKSRPLAALMGMLFAVFPASVSSLEFRYTSVLYGVGILFAVGACWALGQKRRGWLMAAGLICLSLGVYQAYLPMTIGIIVLSLLRRCLMGEEPKGLIGEGLKACGTILLGLVAYFVILKVLLRLTGVEMRTYQGISTMGALSLRRMPQLIVRAFTECLTFAGKNRWNLADSRMIRLSYLALGALSLCLLVVLLRRRERTALSWVLAVFLLLVFPVAVNFIVVMSPDAHIYTLMQYAFVLVGCVPLVLLDCLGAEELGKYGKLLRRGVCLFAGLLVFGYVYSANLNYTANYYYTRQTENYMNSLMTQVRMAEGFTPDKSWAFIGNISDPMLSGVWSGVRTNGGIAKPGSLVNAYSRTEWFDVYLACHVEVEDPEVAAALAQTEEVKAMPCWPSEGSIRVIGDTVVIKCQNVE